MHFTSPNTKLFLTQRGAALGPLSRALPVAKPGPSRVGESPTRRAKMRTKIRNIWGKIRIIDRNLRKNEESGTLDHPGLWGWLCPWALPMNPTKGPQYRRAWTPLVGFSLRARCFSLQAIPKSWKPCLNPTTFLHFFLKLSLYVRTFVVVIVVVVVVSRVISIFYISCESLKTDLFYELFTFPKISHPLH